MTRPSEQVGLLVQRLVVLYCFSSTKYTMVASLKVGRMAVILVDDIQRK